MFIVIDNFLNPGEDGDIFAAEVSCELFWRTLRILTPRMRTTLHLPEGTLLKAKQSLNQFRNFLFHVMSKERLF